MTTFKCFLSEGFKNLFTADQKRKYADEAFAQLQKSYEKVGGIHGNGFANVEDFIKNIPFWKLRLGADGKIVSAAYYKDKGGRNTSCSFLRRYARRKKIRCNVYD